MNTPTPAHRAARCSRDGRACPEVTARTEAGQRTIHIEDCREHGEQLLAIARRIAEVHLQEHEQGDT